MTSISQFCIAEVPISEEVIKQETIEQFGECNLPDKILKLPASLSIPQQGYVPELCMRVYEHNARLILDNPEMEGLAGRVYTDDEFAVEMAIHELRKQNIDTLVKLLDGALRSEPFHEEAFWAAWAAEKKRHAEAVAPFNLKQLDRAKREYRNLQEERQRIREQATQQTRPVQ
jgi:hypothetical protein